MAKEKKQKLTPEQAKDAAKALEILFATDYVSKRELYKANFIRGFFFSAGSILGVAIVLSLLLWFLSVTERIPLVDRIAHNIKTTVQDYSSNEK